MIPDGVDGVKRYLRRMKSLSDLKALADQIFAEATDTVTLTTNSYEGGSAGGQVTFPKDVLLTIVEELIAEKDPANEADDVPGRQIVRYVDRSAFHTRL